MLIITISSQKARHLWWLTTSLRGNLPSHSLLSTDIACGWLQSARDAQVVAEKHWLENNRISKLPRINYGLRFMTSPGTNIRAWNEWSTHGVRHDVIRGCCCCCWQKLPNPWSLWDEHGSAAAYFISSWHDLNWSTHVAELYIGARRLVGRAGSLLQQSPTTGPKPWMLYKRQDLARLSKLSRHLTRSGIAVLRFLGPWNPRLMLLVHWLAEL